MRLPILALLLAQTSVRAAILAPPTLSSTRFRGGADGDEPSGAALTDRFRGGADGDEPSGAALTDEQITAKLNGVPCFVLMGENGGFVALTPRNEEKRAVCFFTDVAEAKLVLNMTQSANPETPIRLACAGLGNAIKLCNGEFESPREGFDGNFKIQARSDVVEKVGPKLKEMMAAAGIDVADARWLLPIFICEGLQGPNFLPVFIAPSSIREMWVGSGQEGEAPEQFVMLDIRMLVADMKTDRADWSKVTFISTEEAAQFANELQGFARTEDAA